jgi:hypothetical protein
MSEPDTKPPSATPSVDSAPLTIGTLAELLQNVPLHSPRTVQLVFAKSRFPEPALPGDIYVHCDHERCGGGRRHNLVRADRSLTDSALYYFITYRCSNCTVSEKHFAIRLGVGGPAIISGICSKIYEEPAFGSPIPKRLFQVIGEANRDHFLQARRAIARGLGIGAYAYYRRIVENTKFDLVRSVLEVARATNAPVEQIELLQKAQSETQFSKAIDMLREVSAIPAVLLIDGQNPLALLHDLLSEGIHQLDDGECLARAQDAEVVLCGLADRMQMAVSERKAEKVALSNIRNRKRVGGAGTT